MSYDANGNPVKPNNDIGAAAPSYPASAAYPAATAPPMAPYSDEAGFGGQAGYAPPAAAHADPYGNPAGMYAPSSSTMPQSSAPGYISKAPSERVPGGPPSSYLAFQDKMVRHGFIRKVYSILTVQLLITFGATGVFAFTKSIRDYVQENIWLIYLSFVVTLICVIGIACCGNARRSYPMNYILLGSFTIAESYMVATLTSFYTAPSVFMAVGMTAILVFGLTLFACQTKYDFTTYGGVLYSFLIGLILLGFVQIFFSGPFIQTVYAAFGAILFSCYIVYDTQLLMSGKKVQLSPDEYVFAALNLYLDIINLFLYLLRLFGKRR